MIRLSIIIQEQNGSARATVTNESQHPTPLELELMKTELEHGQLKDPIAFRELAKRMLKPSSGDFMGSPARDFVASKSGDRRGS